MPARFAGPRRPTSRVCDGSVSAGPCACPCAVDGSPGLRLLCLLLLRPAEPAPLPPVRLARGGPVPLAVRMGRAWLLTRRDAVPRAALLPLGERGGQRP